MRRFCAFAPPAMCLLSAGCGGSPFAAGSADASTDAQGVEVGASEGGADGAIHPTKPVTLVEGEVVPRGIAVDDTRLFWVDAESAGGGKGLVRTVLKDGTGMVATLATGQNAPLDIALDLDGVFWSVDTAGGTPAIAQCLAMSVHKAAPGTAACVTSAPYQTSRIALTTANLVVLAQGVAGPRIGFASKAGSPFTSVAAQGPSTAVGATDSEAYVANGNGDHIDSYTLPGLAVGGNVCVSCGAGTIVDIVVDAALGTVFWATSNGDVVQAPAPPPATVGKVLATVPGTPQRIARDPAYIYVTTDAGSVWAVHVSGAGATQLASGENGPFGVAVDGNDVYWTCYDGTIRAVGVPAP